MSKVAKVVGVIAGAVAIVATAGAAIPGVAAAIGVSASTLATVATVASVVATVAQTVSQLTAKPPNARGSVNQIVIGANQPTPYLMGRSYGGGALVHDIGYGGTIDKVPNPYRFMAIIYSIGPVAALVSTQADFTPITFSGTTASGYYSGWLYRDYQLGALPEADALAAQFGTPTDWSTAHKLSGKAAIAYTLKFDKAGKVFSGGVPQLGAVWDGVLAYDPREDSTYPGGSGSQRIDDETTWAWSDNPAVHALTYAIGRYQNDVKVFGIDLGDASIDVDAFVAWANVCEANGWKVGGTIYEPGDKWQNLKLICQAGAAEPLFSGGKLTVRWEAPRVALDTIALADLADGELSAMAGRAWKDRKNTFTPKYRSEDHQWEYVAAEPIVDEDALAEDGEEKADEPELTLVQDKDQAAQIAAYLLKATREAGPIVLPLKPRMLEYRPGDALALSAEVADLLGIENTLCVVKRRNFDPATDIVTLTMDGETTAKHEWALSQAGVAPPAVIIPTGEDRDDVVSEIPRTFDGGNVEGIIP